MLESALAMVERIVYESLEKHQSGLVGGGGRLRFDAQTNALLLDDDEEDIPEDAASLTRANAAASGDGHSPRRPVVVRRGANLLDAEANLCGEALTEDAARAVLADLRERTGLDGLPDDLVATKRTVSKVAEGVVNFGIARLMGMEEGGLGVVKSALRVYLSLHVRAQMLAPTGREDVTAIPRGVRRRRNPRPVLFLLAGPRSGSSLVQLSLNRHPKIWAPQELYLLSYKDMAERKAKLHDVDATLPVSQGLVNTIADIRGCSFEQAGAIVAEMERDRLDTRDVYYILQEWGEAKGMVLCDKTPPYAWSIETLRRAETIFKQARYVHLARHPHASIASMVKEALNRPWIARQLAARMVQQQQQQQDAAAGPPASGGDDEQQLDDGPATAAAQASSDAAEAAAVAVAHEQLARLDPVIWSESDELWARANANVMDFLEHEVSPARWTRLQYEDFLRDPREALTRVLSHVLQLPFDDACLNPYDARNVATRAARGEGRAGMAAMDPRVLERGAIDAGMADAWAGLRRSEAVARHLVPAARGVVERKGVLGLRAGRARGTGGEHVPRPRHEGDSRSFRERVRRVRLSCEHRVRHGPERRPRLPPPSVRRLRLPELVPERHERLRSSLASERARRGRRGRRLPAGYRGQQAAPPARRLPGPGTRRRVPRLRHRRARAHEGRRRR